MSSTLGELRSFEHDGARVFYRTLGEGKPMLFLHNAGASMRIWERQVAHFERSRQCITFDLAGYGLSREPLRRRSLAFHVDFLGAFCRAHRIHGACLVGNCMGAAIALTFANTFAERAEGVVLFNLLTRVTALASPYAPLFALAAKSPELALRLRSLAERMVTPHFLLERTVDSHFEPQAERDSALAVELTRLYRHRGQLAALWDLVTDVGALAALDQITLSPTFPRTLMLWGKHNRVLPAASGFRLAKRLQPDRFVCVRHGGHLVMHEQAARVNRILEEFLNEPQPAIGSDRSFACWN